MLFVCGGVQADIRILTGAGGIGFPDPRFSCTEPGNPAELTPAGIPAQTDWLHPETGAWIGLANGSGACAYTYIFTLESIQGAALFGEWAGGNAMTIRLNGQVIAGGPDGPAFDSLHPFSVYESQSFRAGANELRFESGSGSLYVNAIIAVETRPKGCSRYRDALAAHLKNQDKVEEVFLDTDGAVTFTMSNGEIHLARLAEVITAGQIPADGLLAINPVTDANADGMDDFEIVYPGGERQIIYYYGLLPNAPARELIMAVLSKNIAAVTGAAGSVQSGAQVNIANPVLE
ncbi:MAG: hypothetical protein GY862_36600 [Gammaproteobacteria bacterium]|nr:hypothetical protein [Gammaproteobacteria bacterium]